jgi:hypothetical protein
MASEKVQQLTRKDIIFAAKRFRSTRANAKWTVIIDGQEFPARPLLLFAAGVAPNDPTNSHMAIKKLQIEGFDTRYEGKHV